MVSNSYVTAIPVVSYTAAPSSMPYMVSDCATWPTVPKCPTPRVVVSGGTTASAPAYKVAPERFDFREIKG
jgi:hypothetical protein